MEPDRFSEHVNELRERGMQETPVDATRKYAQGLSYPANKETVVQVLQRNGAPDDVIQAVRDADKPRWVAPSDLVITLRRMI